MYVPVKQYGLGQTALTPGDSGYWVNILLALGALGLVMYLAPRKGKV